MIGLRAKRDPQPPTPAGPDYPAEPAEPGLPPEIAKPRFDDGGAGADYRED